MEYIDGYQVNDIAALKNLGITNSEVSNLLTRVFCEQIFHHGFVHCDPHPGNVLIRKNPSGQGIQLVLLDHGLYRKLDDKFRLDYCHLWLALISGDEKQVEQYCKKLAPNSSYHILASMLTARAWAGYIVSILMLNSITEHKLN